METKISWYFDRHPGHVRLRLRTVHWISFENEICLKFLQVRIRFVSGHQLFGLIYNIFMNFKINTGQPSKFSGFSIYPQKHVHMWATGNHNVYLLITLNDCSAILTQKFMFPLYSKQLHLRSLWNWQKMSIFAAYCYKIWKQKFHTYKIFQVVNFTCLCGLIWYE